MITPSGNLTKSVAGILNAIRFGIGGEYAAGVPEAQDTTASIKAVGEAILAYQSRSNAFCSALVNRIIFEAIKIREYKNPWAFFKKGMLEYGETVEEIFVNLCDVRAYDPSQAASRLFQRKIPDVSTAFHAMNVQAEYPVTISEDQLHQAFTGPGALNKFIAGIINSVYNAMNYDEFNLMKYMIAVLALEGKLPKAAISAPSAANSNSIVTVVKALSNDFTFMKDKYTMAGNKNFCPKEEQYVLEQGELNAVIDVNTLASAFNIDKVEFAGKVVLFDDIADIDFTRIAKILGNDTTYSSFTDTQIGYLKKIRAIICAKDFFQVYDNLQKMTEAYNGDGLYYNYFLHKWQTLSASPFENVTMLTDQASAVSAVTVTGASTISAAGKYQYAAAVTSTGFANKAVKFSIKATASGGVSSLAKYSIDQYGYLTVETDYATGKIDIIATSLEDDTVSDSLTVTVS